MDGREVPSPALRRSVCPGKASSGTQSRPGGWTAVSSDELLTPPGKRGRQTAEQAGKTDSARSRRSLDGSWILFSPFGLSLFHGSSTVRLSNKHETRKMYFENKGAVQVLLGPQRRSWTATHSEARELPGRRGEDGSGLAWEAIWWVGGVGARQGGQHGQGYGSFQGQWQGAELKTQAAKRGQTWPQGPRAKRCFRSPGHWRLAALGALTTVTPTKVMPQFALEGPVSHNS